jgi:hypothetical protein
VILQGGTWLHVALQVRARDISADDGKLEANVARTGPMISGGGPLWRSVYGLGFIALSSVSGIRPPQRTRRQPIGIVEWSDRSSNDSKEGRIIGNSRVG